MEGIRAHFIHFHLSPVDFDLASPEKIVISYTSMMMLIEFIWTNLSRGGEPACLTVVIMVGVLRGMGIMILAKFSVDPR